MRAILARTCGSPMPNAFTRRAYAGAPGPCRGPPQRSGSRSATGTPTPRRTRNDRCSTGTSHRSWPHRARSRLSSVRMVLPLVELRCRLRCILPPQQADEPAVRRGDGGTLKIVLHHERRHLLDGDERPEGAGAGAHGLLDPKVRARLQLLRPEEAEHHAFLVQDHAGIPSGLAGPVPHLAEPLVQAAGRNVLASDVSGPGTLRVRALGGEPRRKPIELSVLVVEHLGESEALEPPRGSWAEVSGRVRAIHDDGPARIESAPGFLLEPATRRRTSSRSMGWGMIASLASFLPPRSEPEVGFEPTTYHLRGGCSAWLSYSGGWARVYPTRPGRPRLEIMRRRMSNREQPREAPAVGRVMVATDRSETADRAVGWAATLADRYGAELYVVKVVVPANPAVTQFGAAEATQTGAAADELRRYAMGLAGERGRSRVMVDDDPAMAIVRAAEEEAADVLVVGNAGMAGRKEFLLANVPNRISHNARCTVIIVNTISPDGDVQVIRPRTAIRAGEFPKTEPRLAARGTWIAAVMAKHGVKALFGRPGEDGATGRRAQARHLRSALEELGPTFAKLGQVLSTRPDLLPPEKVGPSSSSALRR